MYIGYDQLQKTVQWNTATCNDIINTYILLSCIALGNFVGV